MRIAQIAAGMLCALPVVPPGQAALRLFFSPIGAAENQSIEDANPGLALPIPRTNPTATGGSRLYVWAEMSGSPSSQRWRAIGFDIIVNGGTVTGGEMYNYTAIHPDISGFEYVRWQGAACSLNSTTGSAASCNMAVVTTGEGLANSLNLMDYDMQSEVAILYSRGVSAAQSRSLSAPAGFTGKATLLGWLEFAKTPGPTPATVFFKTSLGFLGPGIGTEPIYLGVGDENANIHANTIGVTSPLPDAYIAEAPEPSGILALAVAALMRRRR